MNELGYAAGQSANRPVPQLAAVRDRLEKLMSVVENLEILAARLTGGNHPQPALTPVPAGNEGVVYQIDSVLSRVEQRLQAAESRLSCL